jgi:hypothetical protein
MTDSTENLMIKHYEMLYEKFANQALGGYQIIEEQLKVYIGLHFDKTRALLNERLHFGFSSDDYRDAALGRLIQVFSKLCNNQPLIAELGTVKARRNHVAHKAFLILYRDGVPSAEYSTLLDELQSDVEKISELISKIGKEINALLE